MEGQKTQKIHTGYVWLICLLTAFVILLVCSANSFLYAFNDNQDVNWYITMGNGILEGKVPYRDLFEQKGPIVYYIFAILCSFGNVYHNVFLLEVLCMTIFLYFTYKILSKYFSLKTTLFSIVLVCFLTCTSIFFVVGGGAVEEYCLPIFAYMLYTFLEYLDGQYFRVGRAIIWGICIGALILIKFTMIVLPGIILILLLIKCIKEKRWKFFIEMLWVALGMVVSIVPFVIYFAKCNALKDFLMVYFYDNIFLYGPKGHFLLPYFYVFVGGIACAFFMIWGVVAARHNKWYMSLFLSHLVVMLFTGNFSYYFLPLTMYCIVGCGYFIEWILTKWPVLAKKAVLISATVILVALTLFVGNPTIEMFNKKEDYMQFAIAKDIQQLDYEDPSMFCYKLWDFGFYNVAGIVPDVKHFAQNVYNEEDFPAMYEAFRSYITEQQVDILIVDKEAYDEESWIGEYYTYYKTYSYRYYKDNTKSYTLSVVMMLKK